MSDKENASIGLHVQVNQPYEAALERVKAALKAEGFGVLTEIDVKDTLKKKLGVDFQRYIILGACNPPLAHRALSANLDVGLLLPCNVVVYETSADTSMAGLVDPMSMSDLFSSPTFEALAADALERFKRVAAVLSA